MITFKALGYDGRLGNQMFQFATTYGTAKRLGYKAFFPIENCSNYIGTGPQGIIDSSNMRVKCDLLDCFDVPQDYFIPGNQIQVIYNYREPHFNYDPNILSIPDSTNLNGYFQTSKYFSEFREELSKEIFRFKPEVENKAIQYWDSTVKQFLNGSTPVSLHVRRTDYVAKADFHAPCSMDYYTQAVSRFDGSNKFLVFSDDLKWCKENFNGPQYLVVETGDPYVDLRLQNMCVHHIIANSTFSWWAAWLNLNEEKIVICPSVWFGPASRENYSDVCPEDWIKI